jgi:hypothetical protein
MDLPNYFLADLPPEAALNGTMIAEACQTLKRNRERYLADRPTSSLLRTLGELGQSWLQPDYPFRKMALAADPNVSGFSRATLANGLDAFFRQLTTDNLQELLVQELGHDRRLDEFCASEVEQMRQRAALARGPEFLVHIAAGNLPNPTLSSMVRGFLVRSAQFVKCASGAAFIPRLFAHSIYEAEPKLGACLEVAEWPGGREDLENALYREADCVMATGTDETLAAVRHHVPVQVRFLGYGHRVSFGYVTREAMWRPGISKAACPLTCFTWSAAGEFRTNNSLNSWLRNWPGERRSNRGARSRTRRRPPSPVAGRSTRYARPTRRKPASGRAPNPPPGQWCTRPIRASRFPV